MTNDGGKCVPILEECPEGFARDVNGRCIPICDETELPEGEVCYDEGDPDDCEPGFIDKGFGCERDECPEGQVGTPSDCEVPPPECPEGQVGTPPDCEVPPGILPPPENGEELPENGEPPENGDEGGDEAL